MSENQQQPEQPTGGEPKPEGGGTKPFTEWARLKQTPDWQVGAARAGQGWAEGREVSESDFDAAIELALGAKMTAGDPFTPGR